MSDDPRTQGFNYGAPLPSPRWWTAWRTITRYADELRHERSATSWQLDMAIRDVRLSCTAHEQLRTILRLSTLFSSIVNQRTGASL